MAILPYFRIQQNNGTDYKIDTEEANGLSLTSTPEPAHVTTETQMPVETSFPHLTDMTSHISSPVFDNVALGEQGKDETTPTVAAVGNSNELMIFIGIGIAAVVLIVASVVLFLLLRRINRLRNNKTKNLIAAKYDSIFTTLRRPSPVAVVPTRRQLSGPASSVQTNYSSFDSVTERPQMTDSYPLKKLSTGSEKLHKHYSMDSSSPGACGMPQSMALKKSKSNPVLNKIAIEPEFSPTISFSLKYDTKSRQLNMKLLAVSELPVKCYGYDVSAVVYLFPRNVDGVHSRCVIGGKEIQLNETFLFDDMTLAEVEKSTLRLVLHYKRKMRSGKENFMGELYMKCGDYDWTSNETVTFNALALGSKVKNGTPEKYLLEDLGSLFVCLEYQIKANRMKVMVRKASNLPKSDKFIGEPGHYVVIHLLKKKEIVKTQETKCHSGYSPIWNQPFLFDLDLGATETHYSTDFVIMRKKLHTKDAVIGHVTIGENACRSGRNHWKEIMSPRPVETAKWHSIVPVLNLNQSKNSCSEEVTSR